MDKALVGTGSPTLPQVESLLKPGMQFLQWFTLFLSSCFYYTVDQSIN